jgi:hypothetical protein
MCDPDPAARHDDQRTAEDALGSPAREGTGINGNGPARPCRSGWVAYAVVALPDGREYRLDHEDDER